MIGHWGLEEEADGQMSLQHFNCPTLLENPGPAVKGV